MGQLRIIRSGACHPRFNMALDDALLAMAGPPTLRIYGWQPAGLSLGYFQRYDAFANTPGEHVMVRRATGGGAIYHAAEITFALTLDLPDPDPGIMASYIGVHQAAKDALSDLGIESELATPAAATDARCQDNTWCFSQPGPGDLITAAGNKLLGSAQRRIHRPNPRMLHHGSLMLSSPAVTPRCGSVAETREPTEIQEKLTDQLVIRIAGYLGLSPVNSKPTEAELALTAELMSSKHSDPHYLRRR